MTVVPKKGIGNCMSESLFLNEEALLSLIRKAKSRDDAAFEELLHSFRPMLDSIVRYFLSGNPRLDKSELEQEATLSFHQAVLKFDFAKTGVAFIPFARTCVHNGIVSYLRSKKELIVDEFPNDEVAVPSPIEIVIEDESFDELCRKIQELLSDYESKIWWLFFVGRTPREIAAQVGRDEKSVTNAIYRIRRKLRSAIPNP